MKLAYRKNTLEVVMVGNFEVNSPNLEVVSYTMTTSERKKFKEGYLMFWESERIRFEPHPLMLDAQKKIEAQEEFLDKVALAENAKSVDELKSIVIDLLRKSYNQ